MSPSKYFMCGYVCVCVCSEGSGETAQMRSLSEPSLLAYAINVCTNISGTGSYIVGFFLYSG